MSDRGAGFRDDEAIAERLCAAVVAGEDEAMAELYGVETVEDPALRELVALSRDESARFIRVLREKVEPRSCEVVLTARQESSLVVHLRAHGDDGEMLFEIVVDDLYEKEGRLLTRDVLKFRPLQPVEEDQIDAVDEAADKDVDESADNDAGEAADKDAEEG